MNIINQLSVTRGDTPDKEPPPKKVNPKHSVF